MIFHLFGSSVQAYGKIILKLNIKQGNIQNAQKLVLTTFCLKHYAD